MCRIRSIQWQVNVCRQSFGQSLTRGTDDNLQISWCCGACSLVSRGVCNVRKRDGRCCTLQCSPSPLHYSVTTGRLVCASEAVRAIGKELRLANSAARRKLMATRRGEVPTAATDRSAASATEPGARYCCGGLNLTAPSDELLHLRLDNSERWAMAHARLPWPITRVRR